MFAPVAGEASGREPNLDGEMRIMHRDDLESILLRNSVGSMETARATCSGCQRTPLTGERLHRLRSDDLLCDLCLLELPEDQRATLGSERMRATERALPVVPRAA